MGSLVLRREPDEESDDGKPCARKRHEKRGGRRGVRRNPPAATEDTDGAVGRCELEHDRERQDEEGHCPAAEGEVVRAQEEEREAGECEERCAHRHCWGENSTNSPETVRKTTGAATRSAPIAAPRETLAPPRRLRIARYAAAPSSTSARGKAKRAGIGPPRRRSSAPSIHRTNPIRA